MRILYAQMFGLHQTSKKFLEYTNNLKNPVKINYSDLRKNAGEKGYQFDREQNIWIPPGWYYKVQRDELLWKDGSKTYIDYFPGHMPENRYLIDLQEQARGENVVRYIQIDGWIWWENPDNVYKKPSRFHPPFTIHRLTDEEFEVKKAAYTAKYGYTVSQPDWRDVFHYKFPVVMDEEEATNWKDKNWAAFTPRRLDEIREWKEARKRRYIQMMGSPTPKVIRAFGSYATMIDNAQDTLVTASILGRIAMKVFPKMMRRAVPVVGWAMLGADILNVMSLFALVPFLSKAAKRGHFSWSGLNPWSKEAKLARAAKMMKWIPSYGDILQALQVSDSVCGFGICLGPIVGFMQDYFWGTCRTAFGQPVKFKPKVPAWETLIWPFMRQFRDTSQLHQGGQVLTDEEHMLILYSHLGATRYLSAIFKDWDPTEEISDPTDYYIEAPAPKKIITLELLNELGVDTEATRVWPSTGKRWSSVRELIDSAAPDATRNISDLIARTRKSETFMPLGDIVNSLATEQLALYSGEDTVEEGHIPETVAANNLLNSQHYFPYDIKQEQINQLAEMIHFHGQAYGEAPPTVDVIRAGKEMGIEWRRDLPSRPTGKAAELFPDWDQVAASEPADTFMS
jgi:hypothetical protein